METGVVNPSARLDILGISGLKAVHYNLGNAGFSDWHSDA